MEPRAEPEGDPPNCSWCGRSAPPAGLEDQSLDGPLVHECRDSQDCQSARSQREGYWLDKQFKLWRVDLDKIRRIQQYAAEESARSRFGGGIYRLSQNVDDPEFVLALAHIRDPGRPARYRLRRAVRAGGRTAGAVRRHPRPGHPAGPAPAGAPVRSVGSYPRQPGKSSAPIGSSPAAPGRARRGQRAGPQERCRQTRTVPRRSINRACRTTSRPSSPWA
jgi:hypothetical protein